MAGQFDRQIGRCPRRGGCGEHPLDNAVFQRLVGHHHDSPADSQRVQRRGQSAAQSIQLAVDRDAQRLERPLGGMSAGAPSRRRNRLVDNLNQLGGRGERGTGAAADNMGGDAASQSFFAEAT